jgi:hypothetical protein
LKALVTRSEHQHRTGREEGYLKREGNLPLNLPSAISRVTNPAFFIFHYMRIRKGYNRK